VLGCVEQNDKKWNKPKSITLQHRIYSTQSNSVTFTFLEGNHYTTQESVQYFLALNLDFKGITTLDKSIFQIPDFNNCTILNLTGNKINDVNETIMKGFTNMNLSILNLSLNPLRNLTSRAISKFMGNSLILTDTYVPSSVYDDLKGTWQDGPGSPITWPVGMK